MFDWVENGSLAKGLKYWVYSSSKSINKADKMLSRKYVWHRFWKNKSSWWDSKQNECLSRSSRPKGLLKKVLCEILQNSQENICAGISFSIK